MPAPKFKLVGTLLLLSPLCACSERGAAASPRGGAIVDSSAGTVALGLHTKRSYRPATVSGPGAIGGTISLQGGVAPRDSVVAVTRDTEVCGDSASVSDAESAGGTLANALVWIEGVASGKPLPEVRRETLTIERCRFEPRIMAVVSGSTINVFSRDRVAHDAQFYREGKGEPVERIRTVDEGQVVPSEKIASVPGVVEVRCPEHPWARAYIAVFDHPYFAVTDERGAFKIDSLPAGTYTVKVWHEGLDKPVEQRVVIQRGGAGRLDVALSLAPASQQAAR